MGPCQPVPERLGWEKAFTAWEKRIRRPCRFPGPSCYDAKTLAACLKFDEDFDLAGPLGVYAHSKTTEDTAESRDPADAGSERSSGRWKRPAPFARSFSPLPRPDELAASADWKRRPLIWLLLERLLRYKPTHAGKEGGEGLAMETQHGPSRLGTGFQSIELMPQ